MANLKRVKAFLSQFGPGSKIYAWPDESRGLRIAEVSFVGKRDDGTISGSAYMQSDPDGLAVCAAVERLCIAYEDDEDIELYEDMVRFQIVGK